MIKPKRGDSKDSKDQPIVKLPNQHLSTNEDLPDGTDHPINLTKANGAVDESLLSSMEMSPSVGFQKLIINQAGALPPMVASNPQSLRESKNNAELQSIVTLGTGVEKLREGIEKEPDITSRDEARISSPGTI